MNSSGPSFARLARFAEGTSQQREVAFVLLSDLSDGQSCGWRSVDLRSKGTVWLTCFQGPTTIQKENTGSHQRHTRFTWSSRNTKGIDTNWNLVLGCPWASTCILKTVVFRVSLQQGEILDPRVWDVNGLHGDIVLGNDPELVGSFPNNPWNCKSDLHWVNGSTVAIPYPDHPCKE